LPAYWRFFSARRISPPEEGWIEVEDVNAAVVETLARLIERMRERIEVTDKPDPVTQDLLIAQTAKLEEAHWMWQAKTA
jgi:starvation-inducible DNA-binding protein